MEVQGLKSEARCLARLSARSGLINEFERVLRNGGAEQPQNIRDLIINSNILGRPNASSRLKIYKELKSRYLFSINHPLFQSFISEWKRASSEDEKKLLSFCLLALNDRTAYVISCEWFFQYLRKPGSHVRPSDLDFFLLGLGNSSHSEILQWTPATRKRISQHYLATVRDCGMAVGTLRKCTQRPALYAAPVRLLLRSLQLAKIAPREIVTHECFKIIGIAPSEVVDNLAELNRQGSIRFRQQADVIELLF